MTCYEGKRRREIWLDNVNEDKLKRGMNAEMTADCVECQPSGIRARIRGLWRYRLDIGL